MKNKKQNIHGIATDHFLPGWIFSAAVLAFSAVVALSATYLPLIGK